MIDFKTYFNAKIDASNLPNITDKELRRNCGLHVPVSDNVKLVAYDDHYIAIYDTGYQYHLKPNNSPGLYDFYRMDGPAIVGAVGPGANTYYLDGDTVSEEEYWNNDKVKAYCTLKAHGGLELKDILEL